MLRPFRINNKLEQKKCVDVALKYRDQTLKLAHIAEYSFPGSQGSPFQEEETEAFFVQVHFLRRLLLRWRQG